VKIGNAKLCAARTGAEAGRRSAPVVVGSPRPSLSGRARIAAQPSAAAAGRAAAFAASALA
jgi:hypothetical protein